ncbi:MAG: hypothetical protein CSB47_06850 [Proteobacteria bacterium]|nr:MAG: hypothetical protein CSB47_06850 [Pseudomonadota bacterium]
MKKLGLATWTLLLTMIFLVACTEKQQGPESVATEFWQAVVSQKMETAKSLASWDTVDYLKYIRSGQLKPERFELGEVMKSEQTAIIKTTLYSQPQGQASVKIPGRTVLVKTEHGWRVNLKETIGSTIQETVGTVFDQLGNVMHEGLKGLDQQLSDSLQDLDKQLQGTMKDVGKALEKGVEELRNELEMSPFNGDMSDPQTTPEGQQI